jgi:hypothetical protein
LSFRRLDAETEASENGLSNSPSEAVEDVFAQAAPDSVSLEGHLGEKLDLCISNRILAQDIGAIVAPYYNRTETGSSDGRCEYWCKWFTSLALADSYHSTSATRGKRDEAVAALLAPAAPDGYLGMQHSGPSSGRLGRLGMQVRLAGAVSDYDKTRDPAALKTACREIDVLLSKLGPGKTDIAEVGDWNGLQASSVLELVVWFTNEVAGKSIWTSPNTSSRA